jgi:uncharacterized membrane protein
MTVFDVMEWLNIAARWIHVFAGIMWVGQTYFFTWLDRRFVEMANQASTPNKDQHVWMVHSGGFYLVEKQKMPRLMPGTLHWFRWEAAITWLSGITLLIIVYYAGGLMVDEEMDQTIPIISGIATLVFGWLAYDLLWRSPIAKKETLAVAVSYAAVVGICYGLTHVMGGRAAYLHVGAMFGTIMTANVWQRILPAQRTMVKAISEGKEPDLTLGEQAKTRSKHNTFMAVPVVFIMISNHYPVTSYGDNWNWAILAILILVGWGAASVIRRS